MLSAARYSAALPCRDLERAKSFYADKLGLAPADEQEGRLFYQGRSGTEFVLFASSGQASGSFTLWGSGTRPPVLTWTFRRLARIR